MNEDELSRVKQQMTLPGTSYSASDSVSETISRLQRYVSNMLSVKLLTAKMNDSLVITGASWNNMPFPMNISGVNNSHHETFTLEHPVRVNRENIDVLVEQILRSGWLK